MVGLNEQKGNMYGFITHTWNPVKGICPHQCSYCYMKDKWPRMSKPRLDKDEFRQNLGTNKFIFVGSSIDLWSKDIPNEWIEKTLAHCNKFEGNTYLFQTKNPYRFVAQEWDFPLNTTLGITLESDIVPTLNNAPQLADRFINALIVRNRLHDMDFMVTVEPIMKFNTLNFPQWIWALNPDWVNIGADSGGNNLLEPTKQEVESLIKELKGFTEVRLKDNLSRIMDSKNRGSRQEGLKTN